MRTLVLTVIGDDRAGLVNALSDVVADHGGNWERSQLAKLAGKFAGIVVVAIPQAQAAAFTEAARSLHDLLQVEVHGADGALADVAGRSLTVEILGDDRPGIVRQVSGVLRRHGVTIDELRSDTRDAPMAGGRLFEAVVTALVPASTDPAALRRDLEQLADEIMVDLTVDAD